MRRHKVAQNCIITPWLSAKADCKENRFIQIGNTLFFNEKYQSLSAGAQHLYLCMALESGGRRDFIFPASAGKKYGIPPRSLNRYIAELEGAGFISKSSGWNTRTPNEYEFCLGWKLEPPR